MEKTQSTKTMSQKKSEILIEEFLPAFERKNIVSFKKWSKQENISYALFLQGHIDFCGEELMKKSNKFFKRMA